jgi:hypothetical protein
MGAVAALTISISFAFLAFYLSQTNTRKHDLFYRFKSTLFDFDKFLKDYSLEDELIFTAARTSIELSKLEFGDFPLKGGRWDELVRPLCELVDKHDDPANPYLGHHIYCHLGQAETVMNDINLMCIRQALGSTYIRVVLKALAVVGLLVIVLLLTYLPLDPRLIPTLYAAPIFFGCSVVVLLCEIAFWVYRDHWNTLSAFMAIDGEEATATNEPKPAAV